MSNFEDMEDYKKALQELTNSSFVEAVMKMNGLCYCAQCKQKLNTMYSELEKLIPKPRHYTKIGF